MRLRNPSDGDDPAGFSPATTDRAVDVLTFRAWLVLNWKQTTVLILSAAAAGILYGRPDWSPYVLIASAALSTAGIQLRPISLPEPPIADDERKTPSVPPPPTGARLSTVVLFVLAGLTIAATVHLTGCGPGTAAYAAAVADCERAPTCETYVACRAHAAAAVGRPFHGACNATADGGTP